MSVLEVKVLGCNTNIYEYEISYLIATKDRGVFRRSYATYLNGKLNRESNNDELVFKTEKAVLAFNRKYKL